MRRLALLLFCAAATLLLVAAPAERCAAWQLEIEAEAPFSAWQAEIRYPAGTVLTAIENGDGAFSEPPDYDHRGLEGGRIRLAAYTLAPQPQKRLVVCRLHGLAPAGSSAADWALHLEALGDDDGRRLDGRLRLVPLD